MSEAPSLFWVRPFQVQDVDRLELLPEQRSVLDQLRVLQDWTVMEAAEHSYTGFWGERMLGFAGLALQWPGRATGWAILGPYVGASQLLAITRNARARMEEIQREDRYRRIEAHVVTGFEAGHRWATRLGFVFEGVMRRFDPEGRDHVLYARISNGVS